MSVDSLGLYLQEQNRVFLAGFKLKGP